VRPPPFDWARGRLPERGRAPAVGEPFDRLKARKAKGRIWTANGGLAETTQSWARGRVRNPGAPAHADQREAAGTLQPPRGEKA